MVEKLVLRWNRANRGEIVTGKDQVKLNCRMNASITIKAGMEFTSFQILS